MYYVLMKSHDIRQNLATEQYLMNQKNFTEPLVLFYSEGPSIIVGRNQNTLAEINQKYVAEQKVVVTRRLSGGGAVYHDLGNLCFSFVVDAADEKFGDFKTFTQPIVTALQKMGAQGIEISGRNDILVAGKKFSGSAMYTKNGKIFSHGTLMLNVDLDVVTHALNVPADKIASKGIKSIRSRVTNLRPYLAPEFQDLTTEEFRDKLLLQLFAAPNLAAIKEKEYQITAADQKQINQIYTSTYNNWNWIYGKSPDFTLQKRQHFSMGTIDARLLIQQGRINEVTFYGDFFGSEDVKAVATVLNGVIYDRQHISQALAKLDLANYFKGIKPAAIIDLLAQ
ncbi:lipoate--protein ligase [Loigolactobacillus backii]|uniref:lipoate--protein ligase n=1 Tax=Loigolactobacillus backii TaxID=375175 RepID=UPI000C1CC0E7|nr:lipoate--protein ligase [Loigolactobacillus backii]PIO82283.1 lipoate--protein ligase [Loigolactobacillus backii]